MADEKFGIENLKMVLAFGVSLGTAIVGDAKDGKFSFTDILGLLPQLTQLPGILAKKADIVNEAKDLSLTEIEELVKSVEGIINNDKVTSVIEHALDVIISVAGLIEDFKKAPPPVPPTA